MFRRQEGVVLIFGVILLIALTATVIAYISLVSSETKHIGYQIGDSQALYLAEAGLQKAIWRLKYNKDWRGLLGEGDELNQPQELPPATGNYYRYYTIKEVEDKDFIGTTGFSTTASSNSSGHAPESAIDNNMSTYWESNKVPATPPPSSAPQWIYITFPAVVSLDRARFRTDPAYSDQRPVDYTWSVKRQTGTWNDVLTVTDNPDVDRTDIFGVQDNVKYLRLNVTKAGDGSKRVIVAEIESPYLHIESQGTVQHLPNNLIKTVSQDFLVTPGSPTNVITELEYSWQEK